MGVAAEATDFEIAVSGIERVAERGAMAAPVPESPAWRLFHASQASRSGCYLRACVACSAAARTAVLMGLA